MNTIHVGNIVLHTLSNLYYKCENMKHERWMNWNHYYIVADPKDIPAGYFDKNS